MRSSLKCPNSHPLIFQEVSDASCSQSSDKAKIKISPTKKFAVWESENNMIENDKYICDICDQRIIIGETIYSCSLCEYIICSSCQDSKMNPKPYIVFSAHGDTCFGESSCTHVPKSDGYLLYGHMDNFAGVQAMMNAYFSGALPSQSVRCHVTYGEERAINGVHFAGARDIMSTLNPNDFVAVIDVTGVSPRSINLNCVMEAKHVVGHVIIEKVLHNKTVMKLLNMLSGKRTAINGIPCSNNEEEYCSKTHSYTYEIWDWCSDPQCFQDESDAYREKQKNVIFLGLPTTGGYLSKKFNSNGDYNEGPVFCWRKDIEAMSAIIIDLSTLFTKHRDNYEHNFSM
jgi:hypothetical protein